MLRSHDLFDAVGVEPVPSIAALSTLLRVKGRSSTASDYVHRHPEDLVAVEGSSDPDARAD